MAIKILTDTGCDLPIEIIHKYNIDILPIVVIKGEIEYLDQVTITPLEVYNGMREGVVYKTAQIAPLSFQKKFEEYGKNKDSVIYLSLSSDLSGTYQTSIFVKETVKEQYPDLDIIIVDSKAASLGFGLIVLEAAKLAKDGATKEDILKRIDHYKDNLQLIFTVDDLEYLFRGGRVSKTAAFVGGLLNIKPILEVLDGKLIPIEKVRGRIKVFKRMVEIMSERDKDFDFKNHTIGISHSDDIEAADKLKNMIEETYGAQTFLISTIGAAVGAHVGPGTIALFFLAKN